jgi:transposase-like protein
MNCTKSQHMPNWSERPLCRRYVAVVLNQVQVGPIAGRNERRMAFGWALGALSDGQAEVLGWWKPAKSAAVEWSTVGAQLAARGVERIGVVVDDSGVVSDLDAFGTPRALVQSCSAEACRSASTLPPHVQRQIIRACAAAKRVQTVLSRAMQRRRDGEGEFVAAAFLDDALQRIDRKLATQVAVPTARPPARHLA